MGGSTTSWPRSGARATTSGVAVVDITTADFWMGESTDLDGLTEALLLRRPAELLVPASLPPDDPIWPAFPGRGRCRHHA